jgi:hypothetical protein
VTKNTIDDFKGAEHIDVRDVIARVEELRDERDESDLDPKEYGGPKDDWQDQRQELAELESLLDELKGQGGDEQWDGDWYPIGLIRDDKFPEAMDELLQDIGNLPKDLPSYLKITVDYDALQMDYSSVEFGGHTYWFR